MMHERTQIKHLIDIGLNGLAIAIAILLVSLTLRLAIALPVIVAPPKVEAQGLQTPSAIKTASHGTSPDGTSPDGTSPDSTPRDHAPAPSTATATPLSPTTTPLPPTPTPLPPTATPLPPTATATPPPATNSSSAIHEERWIDVDLSEQRLTAYKNGAPVRSFLVSTGLPATPTPVGRFRIWIKLRYDDMAGPGYYLQDVPFVMYFHEGYGLHGVTWHANFGHPMSHGCVNLPTAEAAWLFDFAEVGTLVNVHA